MDDEHPISVFLRARWDEAEKAAQACLDAVGGAVKGDPWPDGEEGTLTRDDYPSYPWGSGEAELAYMARTRPALMLRDIESKRRILTEMIPVIEELDQIAYSEGLGSKPYGWPVPHLLRLLALPYSDHDDFDPAWSAE